MLDETKALEVLRSVINLLNESEKNNCILIDDLKELENKQMDISHQIELENGKTLAEISQDEKNEISARKKTLELLKNKLKQAFIL